VKAAVIAVVGGLVSVAVLAAAPAQAPLPKHAMLEPWTGDLDSMVERRYIRFLVVSNRTNYFTDKGSARASERGCAQRWRNRVGHAQEQLAVEGHGR
jgi:hypothetical protein